MASVSGPGGAPWIVLPTPGEVEEHDAGADHEQDQHGEEAQHDDEARAFNRIHDHSACAKMTVSSSTAWRRCSSWPSSLPPDLPGEPHRPCPHARRHRSAGPMLFLQYRLSRCSPLLRGAAEAVAVEGDCRCGPPPS